MQSARPSTKHLRRGGVIVLVAVSLVVILGFTAMSVDIGYLYVVRAELQSAADAMALAAAGELRTADSLSDTEAHAYQVAREYGQLNRANNARVSVNASDVVVGSFTYDDDTGKFLFDPDDKDFPSAVSVTVRQPSDLMFASIFGKYSSTLEAKATAAFQPRDIAVVIDLSGSMKYDSDLRYYAERQINARDIWCALDGPKPSRPYIPGAEHETEYAGDFGPTIGAMSNWGDAVDMYSYSPSADPGLWYIPSGSPTTEPAVAAALASRGYGAAQISAIMIGPSDTWRYRAAVMTGLATWNPSGPTDASVGGSELTWIGYPDYRKNWTWSNYLDWVANSRSNLARANSAFRYRFGPKTFVEFLLDQKGSFRDTDLTAVPEEPLRAVKDGVQAMADSTGVVDQLSLEIFASTSRHEIGLTLERQRVPERLYNMQAGHYDSSTNMGAGLQQAMSELRSDRGRKTARKIIVVMSDGMSNTGPDPISVAQEAADAHMQIYTVSVGAGADRSTMQQVAQIGKGNEFYAFGDPEEYTEQLQRIFRAIGGDRITILIE